MTERRYFSRRNVLRVGAIGVAFVAGYSICGGLLENALSPSLELPLLPDVLPQRVSDIQNAAVFIQTSKRFLSGVKVSSDRILTAGHSIREENDILPSSLSCLETFTIEGLTSNQAPAIGKVELFSTSFYKGNSLIDDLGLLDLKDDSLSGLPSVSARNTPIIPGEPLYFINWQPMRNGKKRKPTGKINTPAIFAGTMIGSKTIGNDIVCATWQSFGEDQREKGVRQGASGGMVVDDNGRLIGIVTKVFLGGLFNKDKIYSNYGISLVGDDANKEMCLSTLEPITPDVLNMLEARLQKSPDECLRPRTK